MLLCLFQRLGRAILRGTDTEYYCVFVSDWGGQYTEELILNVAVFVSGSGEGNVERN